MKADELWQKPRVDTRWIAEARPVLRDVGEGVLLYEDDDDAVCRLSVGGCRMSVGGV